jgi:hypothetical protein
VTVIEFVNDMFHALPDSTLPLRHDSVHQRVNQIEPDRHHSQIVEVIFLVNRIDSPIIPAPRNDVPVLKHEVAGEIDLQIVAQ